MAPARSSSRRRRTTNTDQSSLNPTVPPEPENEPISQLFLDPMLGSPLSVYIAKEVDDREHLVSLVTKHGGSVSPSYSGVPYILVDPHKPSGQSLWRHYSGKKGKIVLNAQWIHECIKTGQLQTFHSNWAGCKVTGAEIPVAVPVPAPAPAPVIPPPQAPQAIASTSRAAKKRTTRQTEPAVQAADLVAPPQHASYAPAPIPPPIQTVDPLVHAQNPFPFYQPQLHPAARALHHTPAAPPQTWQASNAIAPQQTHITPPAAPATHTHIIHRAAAPFREETWENYEPTHAADPMVGTSAAGYEYRYRDDQPTWVAAHPYYDPSNQYETAYEQPAPYPEEPTASTVPPAPPAPEPEVPTDSEEQVDKHRGRKRVRSQAPPATPASSLVVNRNPSARSPTPPTRVVKSTYGGNLFTEDDIEYLKKYIDYCHEQGLVLSLREICERIAIKAPHHTFYSWRRYCNKHQIRLTGYIMNPERSESPGPEDMPDNETPIPAGPGPSTMAIAQQRLQEMASTPRTRSPTPPRALFRSTTGKGVAFTPEDVTFLVCFMEYRKQQGRLDMVAFWKEVAAKAPHHSRASWMKFWRRHRHELHRTEGDEPLPQPPDKKMRYSREDDILLAKYFHTKPVGTSDKIFQAFGRLHPHHPWKGWQEHHRIHKTKIDHLIQMLANGESIDGPEVGTAE
ncbi:hypothetical protein BDN72DRAFT_834084 [Pluteus cervinus]|uniref:Uncharacterized protein n=1 Tax=Pluteus cervinus TaxID=181527 RepID=A0ACD3B8C4_9AGAR|nr:hypothetical protein BDN72DRAFT_834084 [Pluteus cervinus]